MLNQTLSHFFFQLNHPPPPSSSPSPLLYSSGAPPSVSPLVTESYYKFKTKKQQEMEFVEEIEALKTSFWSETTTKLNNPQLTCEDFLGINGGNGVVFGDDLFVEGLLDFSNEDVGVGFVEEEEEEKESISASSCSSSSSSQQGEKYDSCGGFSEKEEPLSVPDSELGVPADDLADLEWLSHFVEDSFSGFSFQHVTGTAVPEKTQTPKQSRRYEARPMGFLTSFPAKARSKRSRTGGRVWSVGLLPSSESSSSCSSSYPVSPSSSSSCLINNSTGENLDAFKSIGKPPAPAAKRQKKKAAAELQQRRCSHCGVQKTPQWRTGPRGAKTLCNACGVRYKSGRLLPEYRPACSPTFSSDIHSNNHRKVLEMRRKKEMGPREPGGGGAGLAAMVQSF